ncbi:hypothetical protein KJ656_17870 [bacterium]|nr:hypothetical protein [bacterium]
MRTAGYTGILLVEAAMIALIGFLQTASANDQRDSDQIRPATLEDHWYRTGIDYIDGDYSQGVATDGKYWYFTHKEKLFKTTYDFELVAVNELAIPQFLLDRAYDHVGDIDYFEGKIYAPLEDEIRKNAVVCVYDTTNLNYTGKYYALNQEDQTHGPWIAADPQTRYFYTSEFSNVTWLNAYDSQKNFAFVRQVQLSRMITRVQGGVFYDGFLYLACDCGDSYGDNVYKVDVSSGNVTRIISIANTDELEGIEAYEMDSGILHIMSETGGSTNIFYHYEKPEPLAHNVRISHIKSPRATPVIFKPIIPEATVHNIGESDEQDFRISCVITDSIGNEIYRDSQTVSNIASYDSVTVKFASWVPVEKQYRCMFFTELSSDLNTDDDTVRLNIEVSNIIDNFDNNLEKWDFNDGWILSIGRNNTNGLASNPRPYENNTDNAIRYLTHFNLESVNAACISLWTKNRLEDGKDFLYVEASTDKVNWFQLGSLTGQQLSWVQTLFSLQSFCGNDSVFIRFHLITDASGTDSGIRIDDMGLFSGTPTHIEGEGELPQIFELFQNFPNPFNLQTVISYEVPVFSDLRSITLKIYNLLGQEIRTLVNEPQPAGKYGVTWEGRDNDGREVTSGIYLYQLRAHMGLGIDEFSSVKKMVYLK